MILGETALSFLGLGLRPPVISWGVLLQKAQNVHAVVNTPWMLLLSVHQEDLMSMDNVLQVRNLRTHFYTNEGVVRAVEDVSFEIFRGKTIGIVGESGCRKSVTAQSILQLLNRHRLKSSTVQFPFGKTVPILRLQNWILAAIESEVSVETKSL